MCGIAGFCISDEYRDKISHEQLDRIMRAGISTNMHRGRDAVGFFTGYNLPSVSPDGNCAVWWKDKGPGHGHLDTIQSVLEERPVPNVFAMHTRAASGTFRPEHGANNHPVQHNEVLAIHNGYIRNHLELKDFEEVKPDTVYKDHEKPAVDSVAISMLMDIIDAKDVMDNVEEIARYLSALSGGWATHIMWKRDPSITLLVAGPGYPLTVQWGAGRLSYASEDTTLRAMWSSAGLPFSKKAHPRVMDSGTFMFVKQGEPLTYGRYDVDRKQYIKLLKDNNVWSKPGRDEHYRVVPKTHGRTVITKFKRKYKDQETQDKKLWSSFKATTEDVKLIYTAKDGLIVNDETKGIFNTLKPIGNVNMKQLEFKDGASLMDYPDRMWCDIFAEADQIFATIRGPRDVDLFGWFGDTEICTTDTGSILNIFDWSKEQETDRIQWEVDDTFDERQEEVLKDYTPLLERVNRTPGGDLNSFRHWFKKHSVEPTKNTNRGVQGVIQGETNRGHRDRGNNVTPLPMPTEDGGLTEQELKPGLYTHFHGRAGTQIPLQFPIILKKNAKSWLETTLGADFEQRAALPFVALQDCYEQDPFEDVDDVDQDTVWHHGTNVNLPFMYNEVCLLHDQSLMTHTAPYSCEYLMLATLALHNRVQSLDVLEYLYYGEMKLRVGLEDSNYQMYSLCDHTWITVEAVAIEAYGLWFRVPETESCVECLASRTITTWPENLEMIRKTFATMDVQEGANTQ